MQLKEQLRETNILVTDELLSEMLTHIGHIDPELRDGMIFPTFHHWIMESKLSAVQIHHIFSICSANLIVGLGEKDTDTVFIRSFSALLCAAILTSSYDLEQGMVHQVRENCHTIMHDEQDVRGYVVDKGWAHSIAHNADLLHAIFQQNQITTDLREASIISVIQPLQKGTVFIDDEPERLSKSISHILLHINSSSEWLERWLQVVKTTVADRKISQVHFFETRTNMIAFLSSLYFDLIEENPAHTSLTAIQETIIDIRRFV